MSGDDAAAFDRVWAEHFSNQSVVNPAPRIDFASKMVVAIFAGPRPSGCSAVTITKTVRDGRQLRVDYEVNEPAGICAAIISSMRRNSAGCFSSSSVKRTMASNAVWSPSAP